MKIKQIKVLKKDRLLVSYENEANDKFSIESSLAVPELYSEIKNIGPFCISTCELPDKSDVTVHTFNLSHHGDENIQAVVISFTKKLSSGEHININTPLKYFEKVPGVSTNNNVLPSPAVAILEKILELTDDYIDGKRAQTNLFDNEKE